MALVYLTSFRTFLVFSILMGLKEVVHVLILVFCECLLLTVCPTQKPSIIVSVCIFFHCISCCLKMWTRLVQKKWKKIIWEKSPHYIDKSNDLQQAKKTGTATKGLSKGQWKNVQKYILVSGIWDHASDELWGFLLFALSRFTWISPYSISLIDIGNCSLNVLIWAIC